MYEIRYGLLIGVRETGKVRTFVTNVRLEIPNEKKMIKELSKIFSLDKKQSRAMFRNYATRPGEDFKTLLLADLEDGSGTQALRLFRP